MPSSGQEAERLKNTCCQALTPAARHTHLLESCCRSPKTTGSWLTDMYQLTKAA